MADLSNDLRATVTVECAGQKRTLSFPVEIAHVVGSMFVPDGYKATCTIFETDFWGAGRTDEEAIDSLMRGIGGEYE